MLQHNLQCTGKGAGTAACKKQHGYHQESPG